MFRRSLKKILRRDSEWFVMLGVFLEVLTSWEVLVVLFCFVGFILLFYSDIQRRSRPRAKKEFLSIVEEGYSDLENPSGNNRRGRIVVPDSSYQTLMKDRQRKRR